MCIGGAETENANTSSRMITREIKMEVDREVLASLLFT